MSYKKSSFRNPQFSDEWEYVTECRNHYDLDIDGIKIEFLAVLGFYYVYFSMIVCLHNLSNSNRSVLYVIIYICLICVLIKFRDVTEWALTRNSPWLNHQGLQQFIQLETLIQISSKISFELKSIWLKEIFTLLGPGGLN